MDRPSPIPKWQCHLYLHYINQRFCHCGFICFDFHWQLVTLLRSNGRQWVLLLLNR